MIQDIQHQISSIHQNRITDSIRLDQKIAQLQRQLEETQLALLSLAYGHYELQDMVFLKTKYPMLYKKIKPEMAYIPLRQLHPGIFSTPGQPVRPVASDVVQNSVNLQRNVIEENIRTGFQSQAANLVSAERKRRSSSKIYNLQQKLLSVGGTILGLILTCHLLIVNFLRAPEVAVDFLLGKYSKKDLRRFANEWFPMILKYRRKAKEVGQLSSDNNIMEQLSDLGAEIENEATKSQPKQYTMKHAISVWSLTFLVAWLLKGKRRCQN